MSLVVGAFFGLGLPTFTGYFTANTQTKSRAKLGGLAVLLVVLSYAAIVAIADGSALLVAGGLAALLAINLALLVRFNPQEKIIDSKNDVSYHAVVTNRTFYLYIIPWLMLSLINDLTMQVNVNYFTTLNLSNYILIENILAGVSAVICGFLADSKGRKRLALMGFILLGLGYATLGLFDKDIYGAWFYITVDGVAGGIFLALFLITIWGDIAQERNGEKYYFLGLLPYLLSTLAGATIGNYVTRIISEGTIFSFAAFFLFAATLPLFYAPETLPDKVMKDRDLKSYIENAKKKAQKEEEKNQQNQTKEPENPGASQDDPNYEEAKKLAEKYY
jgi:sugar phosphate permease